MSANPSVVDSLYLCSEVESHHHTYDDIIDGDLLSRIEQYPYWKMVTYNIDDINLDEWSLDDDLLEKQIEEMKKNPSYPPVIIDNKSYDLPTIVDGIHRLNALDKLGYKTVQAYVPHTDK